MKPLFTEKYYREHWDRFLEKVPGDDYRNLEAELETAMKIYLPLNLPGKDMDTIRRIEAKKIVDSCTALVRKEMEVVKRIENGTAGFGMTTHRQETERRYRYRTRFEFNCLQLSDFKKKYL